MGQENQLKTDSPANPVKAWRELGPTVAPYGVRDLRAYLCGGWSLCRTLWDKKYRQRGEFRGTAAFSPTGDALLYREHGRARFGPFDGFAYREYRFEFTSSHRARVRFDDGRAFHALDLTRGHFETSYDCGADEYLGLFTVWASDRWESRWRIRGPRKDLLLDSCYARA